MRHLEGLATAKRGVERNGGERQGMEVRVEGLKKNDFSWKTESGDGHNLSNLRFTPLNRVK